MLRRFSELALSVSSALIIGGIASGAKGQEPDAQQLVVMAGEERAQHHLEEASVLLERSLALRPAGPTAFNLAGVRADMGDCMGAIELYSSLAAGTYGELPAERAARVEERRQQCQEYLARLEVEVVGMGHAISYLDGEEVGDHLDGDSLSLRINPGPHRLALRSQNSAHEERHDLNLERGSSILIRYEHEPPEAPKLRRSVWLWVAVGAMVVGGVALMLWLTQRRVDSYEDPVLGNVETLRFN